MPLIIGCKKKKKIRGRFNTVPLKGVKDMVVNKNVIN